MKKIIIPTVIFIISLFVVVNFSFAGAKKAEKAPAGKAEKVKLLVWWWGEGDTPGSEAWLKEVAGKFMKENPQITVELVEQSMDQLVPAWQAAVAAQKGADIQFFWTGIWCLEDVWKGDLEDLTKWIPQSEMDHWLATEGVSYQGKPWLVPWYQVQIVMLYNKQLFKKAGLDPKRPPATLEEFTADCKALKKAGIIPLSLGFKDGWGAEWLYSIIPPAQFDSINEIKLAATKPGSYLTARHKDWLVKLHELYTQGFINDTVMSLDFFQGRELFLQGKSGFGMATNGQSIQWIEQMGGRDVADIMRIPVMGPGKMAGKQNTQIQAFGIPTFAENKKEAAEFLIFMHRAENQNRWYEITKMFPADDRFDKNIISNPIERDYYAYFEKENIPYFGIYLPVLVNTEGVYAAGQMVVSGSSPDEAAALIEEKAEKWREVDPEGVENFKKWAME